MNISLKFVPKGLIDNIPALVQIMAWRRPGDKPLSEPMMVNLLTHICVTRPQLVNSSCRLMIKKTSKLHITGSVWREYHGTHKGQVQVPTGCPCHAVTMIPAWEMPSSFINGYTGPCITNVFATRRKNFSQWHRSFQRKLLSHWLKFLRHVAITLVIQGPGLYMVCSGTAKSLAREWVSDCLNLAAFLGTVDSEVHVIHNSCNHYLYNGIIIFPHIDNTQSTSHN